jgi:hypothetical protein
MPLFERGRVKTGGRVRGRQNNITIEARQAAVLLATDPDYREQLAERLRTGKLHPAIEMMIWAYAFGKPGQSVGVTLTGARDVLTLTTEQLMEELAQHTREAITFLAEQPRAMLPVSPADVSEAESIGKPKTSSY